MFPEEPDAVDVDVIAPEDLGEEPELPPHAAAPANTIAVAASAATCRLCVCTRQECHKLLMVHALSEENTWRGAAVRRVEGLPASEDQDGSGAARG